MLESKQVRHFSQWDLPLGFYISVFSILNPVDPLASLVPMFSMLHTKEGSW
jgi:hypothetical protein